MPETGAVLGVDVGFSPTKRSSAVCRLDFTRDSIVWTIERFRYREPERTDTLRRLVASPLRRFAASPLRRFAASPIDRCWPLPSRALGGMGFRSALPSGGRPIAP